MGKLARFGVFCLMALAIGLARLIEVELQPMRKAKLVVQAEAPEQAALPSLAIEAAPPAPAVAGPPEPAAPAPSGSPAPGEGKTYTVAKGDTLGTISKKVYGTTRFWKQILEANRGVIPDEKKIKPGLELRIPPRRETP